MPLVSPEMMITCRYMKKIFTGNLNTKVSFFGFEMRESEYLKCQILRILSDCELSLKGISEYDPETQKTALVTGTYS